MTKGKIIQGVVYLFLGLIVFMGCIWVKALFKKKQKKNSHNLPLFHTALSLSLINVLIISCFYEAPLVRV